MTPIELHMGFRGNRDYLHGTSMYTVSMTELQRIFKGRINGPIKMAIHKIARCTLLLRYGLTSDLPKKQMDVVADLSFWSEHREFNAILTETDHEVTARSPYQESIIADKCTTSGDAVQLNGPTGFLPIEELICMTKVLHLEKYPPEDFQWFFSRLELEQPLGPGLTGKLRVIFEGILGNKITRSTIKKDGLYLGRIFFSKVRL